VLASVSDVLETEATAPVRAELRRLGDVLGGARDVEVRSQRSAALLDAAANGGTSAAADSPAEAVLRQRLVDDVRAEYGAHLTEVSAFIDSEEYGALLDDLDALVVRPPLTPAALAPAARTLRHALRRQRGRVDARLAALGPLGLGPLPSGVPVPQPGEAGLEALHSARKAARRLRYLCEAIGDGEGAVRGAKALVSKAGALGIAARRLQDVIGEHRDAVLFTGFLAEVIRECDETGHDPTAYRSLLRRELRNAEAALRALPAAVGDFASTP
jgi:CHAD domain-containing protein